MNWLISRYNIALLLLIVPMLVTAQKTFLPSIGAQVFIEPGQSETQIENWFKILNENGFTSCRIRMFESYMTDEKGNYDFTLFDQAFAAAKKYDVAIFATLFPNTDFTDVGGMKLPNDEKHWQSVRKYIKALVTHYQKHPSLHSWVLINEPGLGYVPNTDFVNTMRSAWNNTLSTQQKNGNSYRVFSFDDRKFLMDLNTSFLKMMAQEIRNIDKDTELHVNNHNIFQLADEYDFPSWMSFLSSLGASIHPSWHFRAFSREDYTMAVAANSDIIKSGAGLKPFWVTELQGGNNTFSGYNPICPTAEEITQWLWTSIGSGAEGIIFWTLNARAAGIEAGEWALLTNQNRNSDRMDAAAQVTEVLKSHASTFQNSKPVKPKVHVLYTRESLWAEKELHVGPNRYEARNWGAAMKSALAFYQSCLELGIAVDIKEASEHDWGTQDRSGETIILANQSAISKTTWSNLKTFVSGGGQLLLEGLSGYYDETLYNRFMDANLYADFLGAELSEFKVIADTFNLEFANQKMPAHLWRGNLNVSETAKVLSQNGGTVHATQHKYGKGEVIWVPSLIGLGTAHAGRKPLAQFLKSTVQLKSTVPVKLIGFHSQLVTRIMKSGDKYIFILINKSGDQMNLSFERDGWVRETVVGSPATSSDTLTLAPEETKVIIWKRS